MQTSVATSASDIGETLGSLTQKTFLGHTPSTAATFRKKFRKDSGKTQETLSERFLGFSSRVRLGCPKPYNSRHLRLPEHFQNSLPPSTARDASFFQKWFRRGPLRAGHGIPSSTEGAKDLLHFRKTTCICIDLTSVQGALAWKSPPKNLLLKPATSKRGREEGDGTENVINCRILS